MARVAAPPSTGECELLWRNVLVDFSGHTRKLLKSLLLSISFFHMLFLLSRVTTYLVALLVLGQSECDSGFYVLTGKHGVLLSFWRRFQTGGVHSSLQPPTFQLGKAAKRSYFVCLLISLLTSFDCMNVITEPTLISSVSETLLHLRITNYKKQQHCIRLHYRRHEESFACIYVLRTKRITKKRKWLPLHIYYSRYEDENTGYSWS